MLLNTETKPNQTKPNQTIVHFIIFLIFLNVWLCLCVFYLIYAFFIISHALSLKM